MAAVVEGAAPVAAPQTYVYWVAYSFRNGGGAAEVGFPAPITHGAQLVETAKRMAQSLGQGHGQVVITTFALLRVEDAAGQVNG